MGKSMVSGFNFPLNQFNQWFQHHWLKHPSCKSSTSSIFASHLQFRTPAKPGTRTRTGNPWSAGRASPFMVMAKITSPKGSMAFLRTQAGIPQEFTCSTCFKKPSRDGLKNQTPNFIYYTYIYIYMRLYCIILYYIILYRIISYYIIL